MASSFLSKLWFWPRFFWRQLTSMRNALILLLLLAVAAVPGSVYPQRSADPNGVKVFYDNEPELAAVLDQLQLFDVYTSVWFSAIYILLFVSLAGCVLPRTKIHFEALRARPVQTPKNLERMPEYLSEAGDSSVLESAMVVLKKRGFRIERQQESISAEKGYAKETGNLVFHYSLVGVLLAVGFGGGFSFSGQRVLVEGDTFVNNLASYDSFSPGALFNEGQLEPFSLTLDEFDVVYDLANRANIGQPIDFVASVSADFGQTQTTSDIRVNYPLAAPGANVYLTGNGFAPVVTGSSRLDNAANSILPPGTDLTHTLLLGTISDIVRDTKLNAANSNTQIPPGLWATSSEANRKRPSNLTEPSPSGRSADCPTSSSIAASGPSRPAIIFMFVVSNA